MGATQPGQRVTRENIHELPPGSVVNNGDGSRLIHLHDGLWLYCCDMAHHYDRLDHMLHHLSKDAMLCHHP